MVSRYFFIPDLDATKSFKLTRFCPKASQAEFLSVALFSSKVPLYGLGQKDTHTHSVNVRLSYKKLFKLSTLRNYAFTVHSNFLTHSLGY